MDRSQSECGKMQTRIAPNRDAFYAVKYVSAITLVYFTAHKKGFNDRFLLLRKSLM